MGQSNLAVNAPQKKKAREINVFVLLLIVLLVAAVSTYVLPSGEYTRQDVNGRSVVVPDTYKAIEASPVSLMGLIGSIHTGMVEASSIIFFVLIIGGTFGILTATGTIEAFISTLSRKLANQEKWLIPIMMLFFALGGALMGMAEETLAYLGIMIPLAIALGFDVMTGTAIVLIGASVGFTTAVMNPFTVGIAQGIAQLPPFSGMGYRIVLFVVMYLVSVFFVYRYAMKVKRDRGYGFFADGKYDKAETANVKLETRHKIVLGCFLLNFVVLAYGVVKFEWFITEIAGLFTLLGIVIAIVGKLSPGETVNAFMKGASGLISGALIIGVARAIVVILTNGHVIDTILYNASSAIHHLPPSLSVVGMYLLQSVIHLIVPSGSGQAALTMPIMAPLADLVGVTRQTAVLCFSMADGIGNIIFPTSGYFMAGLAIAGIPWSRWAKWILPLILTQYAIGLVAVIVAQLIGYGPF
ncbi:putative basic amino acid antiporter YfcC [Brevibacillus fluminis]|uniref:Putative basic amino acid antiporter YfcC n=1 Tax=Brevibacillus fluminis TaxID=511487 RepID=A0A3M8DUE6_9BACL|nr:AbgT family transporter [Brevibacillus fluminis]RNB91524.1 putative basic amino acid antiporter YfcC [Brevibacillus fluminis]